MKETKYKERGRRWLRREGLVIENKGTGSLTEGVVTTNQIPYLNDSER